MTPALDPSLKQALAARIRFYRDLGLTEFYRRPGPARTVTLEGADDIEASALQSYADSIADHESDDRSAGGTISARKTISTPPAVSDGVPDADRAEALRMIREEIGDCTRCARQGGRHKRGVCGGSAAARLMCVGDGRGADEAAQGLPFVGRAGQLLNNMIGAMGLKREEVYIANVVKCRPPGNRTPEPEEANTCSPFLFKQIDAVRPEVIVALGATAATYLLGQRQPLAGLRGRVHSFRGSKLIVTYHPAFLLRDPRQKKEAWADLQIAMKELGLQAPKRG